MKHTNDYQQVKKFIYETSENNQQKTPHKTYNVVRLLELTSELYGSWYFSDLETDSIGNSSARWI